MLIQSKDEHDTFVDEDAVVLDENDIIIGKNA